MKSLRKRISLILAVMMFVSCACAFPTFAAEDDTSHNVTFNGQPLAWVICDEDGNVIESYDPSLKYMEEPIIELKNGQYFFAYNNRGFDFVKDTTIYVAVTWNETASYSIGYDIGDVGYSRTTFFETGKHPTAATFTTFDTPVSDDYIIWTKNTSTKTKILERFYISTEGFNE